MSRKQLTYIVSLRAYDQDHLLLWQDGGDAPDKYIAYPETKQFLLARRSDELLSKARELGLQVADQEPALIDLDKVFRGLAALRPNRRLSLRTCELLLDGWNTLEDMARSIGVPLTEATVDDPDSLRIAYDKLFYGNNLPSVTPADEAYSPLFSSGERKAIRSYLRRLWQEIMEGARQFCSEG